VARPFRASESPRPTRPPGVARGYHGAPLSGLRNNSPYDSPGGVRGCHGARLLGGAVRVEEAGGFVWLGGPGGDLHGRPRGRRRDCKPSRWAVRCCHVGPPKGRHAAPSAAGPLHAIPFPGTRLLDLGFPKHSLPSGLSFSFVFSCFRALVIPCAKQAGQPGCQARGCLTYGTG
jgi:hypothetical protein